MTRDAIRARAMQPQPKINRDTGARPRKCCLAGGAIGGVLGGILPNANSPSGVVTGEASGATAGEVLGNADSPLGKTCGCSQ